MKNVRTVLFTLFFLAPMATFAQTLQACYSNFSGAEGIPESGLVDVSKLTHIDVVRGSPYLYDEFIVGTVYYNDFTEVSNLPLRFNILTGEFEVVKNDSIYMFGEPEQIDRILLKDEVFTYIAESKEHGLRGFVKMRNFKLPTILTRMSKYVVEKSYHEHYLFDYTNPVYVLPMRDEHYLMKSENEVIRIRGLKQNADLTRLSADFSSLLAK